MRFLLRRTANLQRPLVRFAVLAIALTLAGIVAGVTGADILFLSIP